MRDIILIIALIVFSIVGYFVMWLIDIEIDKYKNEINKAIEKYKNPKISERLRNTMFEWYNVCLKDIDERTSFVYKIV